MASSFSLKVVGLDALTKRLDKLPIEIADGLDRALNEASNAWVNGAVRDAPVYDGRLKNSIRSERKGYLSYSVSANVFYAAYIEFGTKKRFKPIPGVDSSAFKGKGKGDYYDFLNAILDWVRKKGLHNVTNSYTGKKVGGKAAKENLVVLAEAIAWSIIRKGINPHPFFFKQKQTALNIVSREVTNIYKKIQNG